MKYYDFDFVSYDFGWPFRLQVADLFIEDEII